MKVLKGFLKFLFYLVLFLTLCVTALILWPIADTEVPAYHEEFVLKGVNIVDVETGDIKTAKDVHIAQGEIKDISAAEESQYSTVHVVDAEGKYLIPGLWDMHSHSTRLSPSMHHPLQVAHGVTGVRELSGNLGKPDAYWAGATERKVWNQEIRGNQRVAPRFIQQSSFQLDGAASIPDSFPSFYRLDKPEDVEPMLKAFQSQDVDFLKVYFQIPAEAYRVLAKKAPDYGLHLAGHKPIYIDLEEAVKLGQRSFEHGRIFFFECAELYAELHSENWKQVFIASKKMFINGCDENRTTELMQLMAEYQAHWVPTLLTMKVSAFADHKEFIDNANLDYVMYLRKKLMWDFDIKRSAQINLEQGANHDNLKLYKRAQQHLLQAKKIGVPIMAGTDTTDSNNFAGVSLHYELTDLVDSGLSPLEALQAATLVPANYADLQDVHGSIDVGKRADLLVLDENPLVEIANTQKINAVILNGVYYDKSEIEKLKSEVKKKANSMHMNVKFLYGMFSSPLMRRQLVD